MRASSFTGNDRGEGFPAAKLIISGSVRLLNISRIAEGLRSLILSEKRYSIILSYPFADHSPYILPYTQGLFNDFCQSFAAAGADFGRAVFSFVKNTAAAAPEDEKADPTGLAVSAVK